MTATAWSHIQIDDRGRPWITGAGVKVSEIVLDKLAYGWSPEEMRRQHPHLTLAQIHAALGYYYDHQSDIDMEIDRQVRSADVQSAQAADGPAMKRLREALAARNSVGGRHDAGGPA